MQRHDGAEYTEYNVCLPLDVGERGSNKVRQCEVEDPVAGCGEADAFSSIFQREYFG